MILKTKCDENLMMQSNGALRFKYKKYIKTYISYQKKKRKQRKR